MRLEQYPVPARGNQVWLAALLLEVWYTGQKTILVVRFEDKAVSCVERAC